MAGVLERFPNNSGFRERKLFEVGRGHSEKSLTDGHVAQLGFVDLFLCKRPAFL